MPKKYGKIRTTVVPSFDMPKTFERDGKMYPFDKQVVRWETVVSLDDLTLENGEFNSELLREIDARAQKHFDLKWHRELPKWNFKGYTLTNSVDKDLSNYYDGLTLEGLVRARWQQQNPEEVLTPMRSGKFFRPGLTKQEPDFPPLPDVDKVWFYAIGTFTYIEGLDINVLD